MQEITSNTIRDSFIYIFRSEMGILLYQIIHSISSSGR